MQSKCVAHYGFVDDVNNRDDRMQREATLNGFSECQNSLSFSVFILLGFDRIGCEDPVSPD